MKKITILLFFLLFHIINYAQCWSKVSTGGAHTLGLGSDKTLWAWGRNQAGQLGLGVIATANVPTKVGTDINWSSISAGNGHSLALKTNGTLWAWGRNTTGQLGNAAIGTNLSSPAQVGTDSDWVFISAGDEFSIAIKANGTLWAWGDNTYGQIGNNTAGTGNIVTSPSQVGTDNNWLFASGGTTHVLAIKTNGTLWGFGQNNFGKLGDGTIIDKLLPEQIGTEINWKTAEASIKHSVGLKLDGSLWTWGDNTDGQLGNGLSGSTASQSSPINIDVGVVFSSITRGQKHTNIIRANGTLWSWGGNAAAQLGDNSFTAKTSPTQIATAVTNWASVSSKVTHCAALKSDGTLYTWGSNLYGQLGDGGSPSATKKIPTLIVCPALDPLANNKFDLKTGFSLYPNPTSSILNISLENETVLNRIVVIDMTGKIILEQIDNFSSINVENLSNGIYLIKMFSDDKSFQGKFVKN